MEKKSSIGKKLAEKKDGGQADTSNYDPPISPVKIPDNDTGFNLVKKSYRRFIWNLDDFYKNSKKKG